MIVALVAKLVGPKLAPFLVYGTLIVAVVGGIWWLRHDAYNDGVRATDAKWEEAGRRLRAQAQRAAGQADAASVTRVEEFTRRQELEKERLDAAEQNGTSPLDVLFGS